MHDDRSGTRGGIAEKFGQKLLFGPVVGVHEGDETPAGVVDARIAGRRDRRFVERQGADAPGVFRGVAGAAFPRIVRRAVFDQDEFEIGVALGQQALHACAEVGRCIVDRDYDREVGFGLGHRLLVLRSIEIPDVPCDALHEYFDRLDGRPGVVGREQQAVRFTDREQGIARFERFVRENIEPRPGEPSGVEGRGQRRFVHDAAGAPR